MATSRLPGPGLALLKCWDRDLAGLDVRICLGHLHETHNRRHFERRTCQRSVNQRGLGEAPMASPRLDAVAAASEGRLRFRKVFAFLEGSLSRLFVEFDREAQTKPRTLGVSSNG